MGVGTCFTTGISRIPKLVVWSGKNADGLDILVVTLTGVALILFAGRIIPAITLELNLKKLIFLSRESNVRQKGITEQIHQSMPKRANRR